MWCNANSAALMNNVSGERVYLLVTMSRSDRSREGAILVFRQHGPADVSSAAAVQVRGALGTVHWHWDCLPSVGLAQQHSRSALTTDLGLGNSTGEAANGSRPSVLLWNPFLSLAQGACYCGRPNWVPCGHSGSRGTFWKRLVAQPVPAWVIPFCVPKFPMGAITSCPKMLCSVAVRG